MYDGGDGVERDEAKASGLYQKACAGGSTAGCVRLGLQYAFGIGVAKDEAKAVEPYAKACDNGDPGGCANLGVMYGYGHGVARDEARSLELHRKACDGGETAGCFNLGHAEKDRTKAAESFARGCLGADGRCCYEFARMRARGDGGVRDFGIAAHYMERACGLRVAEACHEQHVYSCSGGDAQACSTAADSYATGEGVKKDVNQARRFYSRACQMGLAVACAKAGEEPRPKVDLVAAMTGLNNPPSSSEYARAAKTLVAAGEDAVPPLLEALEQGPPGLRGNAGGVLAQIQGRRAIPALKKALARSDNSPIGLMTIALSLSSLGEVDVAVSALAGLLEASDPTARFFGATALGVLGPKAGGATPALRKVVDDSDSRVSTAAREALAKIGSPR